jgi:hypothetical protein
MYLKCKRINKKKIRKENEIRKNKKRLGQMKRKKAKCPFDAPGHGLCKK